MKRFTRVIQITAYIGFFLSVIFSICAYIFLKDAQSDISDYILLAISISGIFSLILVVFLVIFGYFVGFENLPNYLDFKKRTVSVYVLLIANFVYNFFVRGGENDISYLSSVDRFMPVLSFSLILDFLMVNITSNYLTQDNQKNGDPSAN